MFTVFVPYVINKLIIMKHLFTRLILFHIHSSIKKTEPVLIFPLSPFQQ